MWYIYKLLLQYGLYVDSNYVLLIFPYLEYTMLYMNLCIGMGECQEEKREMDFSGL